MLSHTRMVVPYEYTHMGRPIIMRMAQYTHMGQNIIIMTNIFKFLGICTKSNTYYDFIYAAIIAVTAE